MNTDIDYTPWSLLPVDMPKDTHPPIDYFYQNVAKHLIRDTVRIMANGIQIDLNKVEELEETLDQQLAKVKEELEGNPYVKAYLQQVATTQRTIAIETTKAKFRSVDEFRKPFKYSDMVHRSYFMYVFSKHHSLPLPATVLPSGVPKWTAALVNKFASSFPLLDKLLKGTLSETHPYIAQAMENLAMDKCKLYNSKYEQALEHPKELTVEFNSSSSKQKQEIFAMLGITSEAVSKTTGNESFTREEIEKVNNETSNETIKHFTQCLIDHSYAAIVKNNFIAAFYKYTINGRLYGQYKLLGAKSGNQGSKFIQKPLLPFVEEILRRKESNSEELLSDTTEDNSKPSLKHEEGQTTISQESTPKWVETVPVLPSNVEDLDIVWAVQ